MLKESPRPWNEKLSLCGKNLRLGFSGLEFNFADFWELFFCLKNLIWFKSWSSVKRIINDHRSFKLGLSGFRKIPMISNKTFSNNQILYFFEEFQCQNLFES